MRPSLKRNSSWLVYDSTSQQLAALKINLGVIRTSSTFLEVKAERALTECLTLAEECNQEVRTLSHLLPPHAR